MSGVVRRRTMRFIEIPRTLSRADVTVLVDTREQRPYSFPGFCVETGSLVTGDYSIRGFENEISIERKSFPDLLACIGGSRARFERELRRLKAYAVGIVVVEASWADLTGGDWRSAVTPAAVTGSVCAWISRGSTFIFAGDRKGAESVSGAILWHYAKQQHRKLLSCHMTTIR
jgi:ERCC4-type nuclease